MVIACWLLFIWKANYEDSINEQTTTKLYSIVVYTYSYITKKKSKRRPPRLKQLPDFVSPSACLLFLLKVHLKLLSLYVSKCF